jgi:hypothetical protein
MDIYEVCKVMFASLIDIILLKCLFQSRVSR